MSSALVHRLRAADGGQRSDSVDCGSGGPLPASLVRRPHSLSDSSAPVPISATPAAVSLSAFSSHADFQALAAHIRTNYNAYQRSRRRFLGQPAQRSTAQHSTALHTQSTVKGRWTPSNDTGALPSRTDSLTDCLPAHCHRPRLCLCCALRVLSSLLFSLFSSLLFSSLLFCVPPRCWPHLRR